MARFLNTASASPSNPESPLPPPPATGATRVYSDKIQGIVDQISRLSLIEVADLNECLKTTLKIPDTPMMAVGAPMAAAPKAEEEGEEDVKKAVKTAFTVKLVKYDDAKKVALIKEIKNQLEGVNLVQAKQFVEKAPQIVKADLAKDDAEKLKALLEAAGATVEIV